MIITNFNIVTWFKVYQQKTCIQRIREHLTFFGFDTSHLTDDNLKERVLFASKTLCKAGLTTHQVIKGLHCFRNNL